MSKKTNIVYSGKSKNRMFIIDTITNMGSKYGIRNVFTDFVEMSAIALSNLELFWTKNSPEYAPLHHSLHVVALVFFGA